MIPSIQHKDSTFISSEPSCLQYERLTCGSVFVFANATIIVSSVVDNNSTIIVFLVVGNDSPISIDLIEREGN